jgi:hypothetical protein
VRVREWLSVRAQLVGSAVLVGCVLTGASVIALSFAEGTRFASTQVFSLSALVFGFGLFGWASAALSGRTIEHAKRSLNVSSDWTEASARRAMARISGFGFGGMVGVMVVTTLLR